MYIDKQGTNFYFTSTGGITELRNIETTQYMDLKTEDEQY